MTKSGCGDQERSLNIVVLYSIDQLRHGKLDKTCGVRNESAEAPEGRIELADDSVRLKLEQTGERNLRVSVFANECFVIATTGNLQITRINFSGDFAKRQIA